MSITIENCNKHWEGPIQNGLIFSFFFKLRQNSCNIKHNTLTI